MESGTLEILIELTHQGLYLALLLAAPIVLAASVAGVVAAVFQAATQISEPAASFLLKVVAAIVAVIAFAPWLTGGLRDFTNTAWRLLPALAGASGP